MATGYPFWSEAELADLAAEARRLYVERYKREVQRNFADMERECADEVRELLAETDCLGSLGSDPDFFQRWPKLLRAARFLTSPVISQDTLKIVSQEEGVVDTILALLDRERFPWIESGRVVGLGDPEVTGAISMTAKLMAEQRSATSRRIISSHEQEQRVREALTAVGMSYVEPEVIRERLRELGDDPAEGLTRTNYQEVLRRGEFTREIAVAGTKCDVPSRLVNGDLLPIECKVSNTEVNSVKRLNRETGGKHERWRSAFGASLHTGAVLGGVFKLRNLVQAQSDGILIFFDHDLASLRAFIDAGGTPRQPS